MATKKVARAVVGLSLVLGAGSVVTPAAHAAPECRGVSAVIQCWDQRLAECLRNLSLPPVRC